MIPHGRVCARLARRVYTCIMCFPTVYKHAHACIHPHTRGNSSCTYPESGERRSEHNVYVVLAGVRPHVLHVGGVERRDGPGALSSRGISHSLSPVPSFISLFLHLPLRRLSFESSLLRSPPLCHGPPVSSLLTPPPALYLSGYTTVYVETDRPPLPDIMVRTCIALYTSLVPFPHQPSVNGPAFIPFLPLDPGQGSRNSAVQTP